MLTNPIAALNWQEAHYFSFACKILFPTIKQCCDPSVCSSVCLSNSLGGCTVCPRPTAIGSGHTLLNNRLRKRVQRYVGPLLQLLHGIARRSDMRPPPTAAGSGYTVQPPNEWDRQTDEQADRSQLSLMPPPTRGGIKRYRDPSVRPSDRPVH